MPQNKPITYIAQIEYLQSYEVVKNLIDEFMIDDNKDFQRELLNKIKVNNPDTYDLSMEDSFDFLKNELDLDILQIFSYLGDEHFIVDNGKIKLCGKTLEEYHLLSSSIDTTTLLAKFILNYSQYLDGTNRLRYIDNNFNTNPPFYGELEKKIKNLSDNHIHLGGALGFDYRLHKILQNPHDVNISSLPDELFVQLTRCRIEINNIILSISVLETLIIQLCVIEKNSKESKKIFEDLKLLFRGLKGEEHSEIQYIYEKYQYSVRDRNNQDFFNITQTSLVNEFLKKSMDYFALENIPKADKFLVLFFVKTLMINRELKKPIEIYLILRNILKVYIVQQHRREGFGYFATYTNSSIRRSKTKKEKEHIIKSIYNTKIPMNIEGRITFKDDVNTLVDSMLEYIIPFEVLNKKANGTNRLKFMFHFIKEDDEVDHGVDSLSFINTKNRWQKLRKNFKKQAMVLNTILTNPTYRKYVDHYEKRADMEAKILESCIKPKAIESHCLEEESKTIDFIGNYISGIDAANKEYKTPPEVFAPIYRFYKNSIETSGLVLKREYPFVDMENDDITGLNFQYSFHAGEDFRDILSGLRAIFETVLFLDLKENDRIGHALALGVDAKEFSQIREKRRLSKLEVLDNSVFAYYLINQFDHKFTTVKENLKDKILGISKEIYNQCDSHEHYHIDDLIGAWFLRRNCPNEIIYCMNLFRNDLDNDDIYSLKELLKKTKYHPMIPNLSYIRSAIPDFFPYRKRANSDYEEKYRTIQKNRVAYQLYWKYNTDPTVKNECSKIYEYGNHYETKFYEYLQDIMMENIIAKNNIIIETLPSSNILIGQFKHYHQHPITRFKPVKGKIKPNRFGIRKKRLRVIIGTDNPGLQNTTLLGEIYQLKNALEKNKHFSREDIEKYLLEIIREGNELWR